MTHTIKGIGEPYKNTEHWIQITSNT